MSIRSRIHRLQTRFPDRPRPVPLPGESVEDLALAVLRGEVRHQDIPAEDGRRVESLTALLACVHVERDRRADPGAPARAGLAYPKLRAAAAAWVAHHEPKNTDTNSED